MDAITPFDVSTGAITIADLNTRIAAANTALNSLTSDIAAISNKSAIIRQRVALAQGTTAGQLVYWDSTNNCYAPAQALLKAVPGLQGDTLEADNAHVEGLVLEIAGTSPTTTGTLLCGGLWTASNALLGAIFGTETTPATGVYYLSATTPGGVTSDPGAHLRQPVLVYHGNNEISMSLFYMAHDNHYHATTSDLTWTANTDGGLDALLPASFGAATEDTAAVFVSGALNTTDFTFPEMEAGDTQQVIHYGGTAASFDSGAVVVFNHFPFAYGAPVVRSVQSVNNGLSVRTANGVVTLIPNDFTVVNGTGATQAVASITGGTLTTTPVVANVEAGAGITIGVGTTTGSVLISNASLYNTPLDPDTVNHNGTTVVSDGVYQYFQFPAGRDASMIIQKTVVGLPVGTKISLFADVYGAGTASITCKARFVPQPDTTPVNLPSTLYTATETTWSGTAGKVTHNATALTGGTISGSGVLVGYISAASPGAALNCLRLGFTLTR